MPDVREVHRQLSAKLIFDNGGVRDDDAEVAIRFTWTTRNPHEVAARFMVGELDAHRDIVWTFARELLAEAFDECAGDDVGLGDITFHPLDEYSLDMTLDSPSGRARFELHAPSISEFLADTEEIIPVGHELRHCRIDHAIEEMLARAA
jgi:hypothetical protein